MIVSQQYQVETDEFGNPIAYFFPKNMYRFHKLRSIRMPNHPAPRISHSPQWSGGKAITNIHAHNNNPNNIQFMPAISRGNRKTGDAGRMGWIQILLMLIMVFAAGVLIVDLLGLDKKWAKSEGIGGKQENSQQGNIYGYQEQEDKQENQNKQNNNGKWVQSQTKNKYDNYRDNSNNDDNSNAHQLKIQVNQQQPIINPNNPKSIQVSINTDDRSGEWILKALIQKLAQQQQRISKINKTSSQNNRINLIQVSKFRSTLMYKTTDRQWISFINLAIHHYNCHKNQYNNNYGQYCQQLIAQLNRLKNNGSDL